jgi:hypothetical protein
MELRLFPFRLKFMCLNGVAVEVKWKNLKFSPIDFFLNFSLNEDLKWFFIGSTTLNMQWVCIKFWTCSQVILKFLRKYSKNIYFSYHFIH